MSQFLAVKPGSLRRKDILALKKADIVVIEHEHPETLRIIETYSACPSGDLLRAAMTALNSDKFTVGDARQVFAKEVAKYVLGGDV